MKIVSIHPVYALETGFFNRDFGQIGYTLAQNLGLNTEVRCLKKKGQNDFIIESQKRFGTTRLGLIMKLWSDANVISLLHMYHIWHRSLIYCIIYKIRNPKGIIYIKLDTPFEKKNDIMFSLTRFILPLVDLIGGEDTKLVEYLQYKYNSKKILLTTSGAIDIKNLYNKIDKKSQIALVGRFGDPIKNYELFLTVLENYDISYLNGWNILFLGSYTSDFYEKVQSLIIKKPSLKNIIKLHGFIEKKEEMYHHLLQSKILLHTSNYEGDPNFQYDAMFCGCLLVSTDVGNIDQNYPKESRILYKPGSGVLLHDSLKQIIKQSYKLTDLEYTNIQSYCLKKFTWKKVLKPVLELI